jgi:hypothetical protein
MQYIEYMKAYFDDTTKATNTYLAGEFEYMRRKVDFKNIIPSEDIQKLFEFFVEAMSDPAIEADCSAERMAFMILKAYQNDKLDVNDLRCDDKTLDCLLEFDKDASIELDQ